MTRACSFTTTYSSTSTRLALCVRCARPAAAATTRTRLYAASRLLSPQATPRYTSCSPRRQAHVMIVLCSGYLAIAFLSWLVNRFTDGVTPTQRKLNQETRRRAEDYIRSKRDN